MHLVPDEHTHRRTIDEHAVCEAIAGTGDPEKLRAWADRFSLLGDRGRLTLLMCIHAVPGICVSDLAVAAGMNDTAVSQALRLLRTAGLIQASKDGRIMRYRLIEDETRALLHHINPAIDGSAGRGVLSGGAAGGETEEVGEGVVDAGG